MKHQSRPSRFHHSSGSLFVLSTKSTGVLAAVAVGLAAAARPYGANLSNGRLLLSLGALQCGWIGATLAISFLEAPVKFLAPSPERRSLIDVGRHVFSAINKAEVFLAAFDLLGWYLVIQRGLAPPFVDSGAWSVRPTARGFKRFLGWSQLLQLAPGLVVFVFQSFTFLPVMRNLATRYVEGRPIESAKVHGVYVALEAIKVAALGVSTVSIGAALLQLSLPMDAPQSRSISQRKRSYSTTAYSSQEEEALSSSNSNANNNNNHPNALPSNLLAATVGSQVLTYEFINNGTVNPISSTKSQQPPLAVPGQYEGIQMSNERIPVGVSSLKWSPDSTIYSQQ
ncbi:hypothetical protein BGX27_007895 [Mortierella sp. AM989]|nr:hypothetical protein BGX27_007895 [Mortierella sp. AM989]